MKKLVLDTNIFLRFLLNDIPSQANQAEKIFQAAKFKKNKLLVPQIVIFEIIFALEKYYGFPKKEVLNKIKVILAMEFLSIADKDVFTDAVGLYVQNNLSFPDSFLISFTKQQMADIFSFDKEMKNF